MLYSKILRKPFKQPLRASLAKVRKIAKNQKRILKAQPEKLNLRNH